MTFKEWCIVQFKQLECDIPEDTTIWLSTLEDLLDTDIITLAVMDGVTDLTK